MRKVRAWYGKQMQQEEMLVRGVVLLVVVG
jgi:hypothetical protein